MIFCSLVHVQGAQMFTLVLEQLWFYQSFIFSILRLFTYKDGAL